MSEEDDYGAAEDNINYKSITCENIPDIFLDKLVAKKHFGRFGKIKRFILRPKRFSCTVEYESANDAEDAISNAGEYYGKQFIVKYTPNEVVHARNTEEWVDPDVQAELDAMRPQMRLGPPSNVKPAGAAKLPKPILKTKALGSENLVKMVDSGVKNELEAILRRQASDNEDKLRILDARDKLIRLTTVRTTDIKRAESIKGFCPDMCPEKERLLRENRNQIATFEQDETNRSRMDHKLAIKEYSRSSADQETPLPHELRPESVLKLTMTYLMHKVMDLCDSDDVNVADWYHFIWDRTRSIRKDITQQELCSPTTVTLVEQCARFHIHCAARLVAEESSVFDQKINTENLTKCLQTLKYMYHDLRLQNKKCPNEAEFRTYVILLNLNDSNFLWEVKQLPEEIQNSKPVRFALATYLAMESNNYVRFFKLVREATYMNACILLRYFTQVRIQAIRAIMIAYKWPMHVVAIPVTYFRDILAFESTEAARIFFEYHGLDCEGDKVNLDKKAFYMPEMPFLMDRALIVVESKRKCTAGEAICGQPLDSFEVLEKYAPHNSFDHNGYLKAEAWNAEDQLRGADVKKKPVKDSEGLFKVPSASPPISPRFKSPSPGLKQSSDPSKMQVFQPITKPPIQPQQPTSTPGSIFGAFAGNEAQITKPSTFSLPALEKPAQELPQKPTTKSIFGGAATQLTGSTTQGSSTSVFGAFKTAAFTKSESSQSMPLFGNAQTQPPLATSDTIFKHFQMTAPNLSIFEKGAEPSKHKTDAETEQKRREAADEELRKKRAEEEREKQRKQEELRRIEEERRREDEKRKRQQKLKEIAENSNTILSEILENEILASIKEIANSELKKHQNLLRNSERISSEIMEECIRELVEDLASKELEIVAANRNLLRKYFTLWNTNVRRAIEHRKLMESTPIWIAEQTVTEALPQQSQTLELKERYLLGVPGQFHLRSPDEKPIDVFRIFLKEFSSKRPLLSPGHLVKSRRYFKFVISLPREDDELRGFNSYMNSWLEKRIRRVDADNSEEFLSGNQQGISICIRKVEGIMPTNEKRQKVSDECDNAHGLIFVMSSTNLLSSRKRLHHLLKLSKIHTKIPVAVIIYNATADEEYIEEELHIQKLIDDEKVSYYSLFPSTVFKNKNNLREAFEETFKFLAHYTEQNYGLEMQNLCSFLRTALGDEFWKRLQDTSRINPSFRKICTQPDKIASLYNEAIDLLIQMLEEDYEDLPEFPRELRKFAPRQVLDIPLDIEYFPVDWKDNTRNSKIQNFLKGIKLKSIPELPHDIPNIERSLLDYASKCIASESYAKRAGYTAIKHLLESINGPEFQNLELPDRLNAISWLPMMQSVALELLTCSWHSKNSTLPKEIIYNKLAFREYTSVPWWFDNVTLKSIKMEKNNLSETEEDENSCSPPAAKRSKTDTASFDIDALLEKSTALLEKADRNIAKYKTITTKSREISRTLDEKFYKQELFNRKLKRYLQSHF